MQHKEAAIVRHSPGSVLVSKPSSGPIASPQAHLQLLQQVRGLLLGGVEPVVAPPRGAAAAAAP